MNRKYYFLHNFDMAYAGIIKNWGPLKSFIDFECHFDKMVDKPLYDTAKTLKQLSKFGKLDVIPNISGAKGFLANARTCAIFAEFNLPPHEFFPISIEHKTKTYADFQLVHVLLLIETDPTPIDFKKSFFGKNESNEQRQFDSIEAVCEHEFSMQTNAKIFLTDAASKYDLFFIRGFDTHIISEKLAEKLKAEKITGIKIELADNIF